MYEADPFKKPRPGTSSKFLETVEDVDSGDIDFYHEVASKTQLHVCGGCGSDTVQIVTEVGFDGAYTDGSVLWDLNLSCSGCGHEVAGQYTHEEVDALHDVLDDRAEKEMGEMREYADLFKAALSKNHILPEDF